MPLPELPTDGPDGLALIGNSLFYSEGIELGGSLTLYELDATTGAVIDSDSFASLGLPSHVDALATVGGLLVAVDYATDRLYFVDTNADTAVGSIALSVDVVGGAAGAGSRGSIFVTNFNADAIYEVDANTGALLNSFNSPEGGSYGLAFVNGSLYTGGLGSSVIYRLDPDLGTVLDSFSTGFVTTALGGDDSSGTAPFSIKSVGFLPTLPPIGSGSESYALPNEALGASLSNETVSGNILQKGDPVVDALGFELATLAAGFSTEGLAALSTGDSDVQVGASDLLQIVNEHVLIDAAASGDAAALLEDLNELGLQAGSVFGRLVSGWLPIDAIADAALLGTLQFARPSYRPVVNVGRTTSQADVAMGADTARSLFGVDGTGVTIGVLSDSFDTGSGSAAVDVTGGDLPGPGNPNGFTSPVNVLSDTIGIDEGRAMLQLIHDVAPGANLAFHTAFNGQADFARGILELQSLAGADVIVDDVIYFAEPMFQDGVIAQAIDTVVANGAAYFSSAGNNARDSWEDTFRPSGTFQSGTELHDFDPGPGVDVMQSIMVPAFSSVRISFQWDSPFFSVSGGTGSPNDLDLFVFDSTGTSLIASATSNNIGGDAVEVFSFTNRTSSSMLNFAIGHDGGPVPGLIKWVAFDTITPTEYATNSPTSYGHANAAGASAVGAVDYRNTPGFGVSPPRIENFSSAGGIPILFDNAGNPIYDLRAKPNISAPDGTNTTFFGSDSDGDGFPNFFGTSAAAPHAAAVAGLMFELNEVATPAEIYAAMEMSAIDMDDPATPEYDLGFDNLTGHGMLDAVGALTLIQVDPALVGPRVISISPAIGSTNNLNITELTVDFSEALEESLATDPANFSLVEVGADGVFESGDDILVSLTPALTSPTRMVLTVGDGTAPLPIGTYQLVLLGSGTIVDAEGNPLNSTTGPDGGSDVVHNFSVVLELPRGGDTYLVEAAVGDEITLQTETLFDAAAGQPLNDLDPQLVVYGPGGNLIALDQDSAADGKNALITFVAAVEGMYTVQVTSESGVGEYLLSLQRKSALLAGDFNGDLKVNGLDFLAWQRGIGLVGTATRAQGDADEDHDVDNFDLNVWQFQDGKSLTTASESANGFSTLSEQSNAEQGDVPADPQRETLELAPFETVYASQVEEISWQLETSEQTKAEPLQSQLADVILSLEWPETVSRDEEEPLVVDSRSAGAAFDAAFAQVPSSFSMKAEEFEQVLAEESESEIRESNYWIEEELLEEVFG